MTSAAVAPPAPPVVATPAPALSTQALTKSWGAFVANDAISFSLPVGARQALIGPNGAGKTTFVNLLTGAIAPTSGDVFLDGERVTRLPQHRRARRGLTRTYQVSPLFPELTVLESVLLALCERDRLGGRWWQTVASRRREIDEGRALLAMLRLEGDADRRTGTLAYGRRRLVELALALATRPRILLLDEPAAGIPPADRAEVFDVLERLPADVSILLIEHDMELVFRFARRISVLAGGRLLAEGSPDEIAADARVREVYLGEAKAPEPRA